MMCNRLVAYAALTGIAGSVVFGFGTKSVVHAQSKTPAYSVAEVEILNRDRFLKEVAPKIAASVKEFGGQFIVRGGQTVPLDGAPPKAIFIIRWESMDQLKTWQASKAWQDFKPLRDQIEKVRAYGVEGLSR
jgi:uncharacterized protein (DUF1330 family)